MRRGPWFRLLASFIGVWLPLYVGEPSLLSPCHMHGVFAATSAHAGAMHAHGHGAMEPGRHESAGKPTVPAPHDETHCSCVGCCAPAVARVAVAGANVVTFVVGTQRQAPGFSADAEQATPSPEFSRPYATGPPRA